MALEDGRTLEGKLVALDRSGNFYLTCVQQTTRDSIFELQKVIVPFACIQEMSVLTPIQTKPAAAAKR
jgi:small nuclear ribonucleoprotein (snRNP)-like protein